MGLREMESGLPPGFRFYPSDEELVCFYLRKKVANERVSSGTLTEVDLHAREPWELPEAAKLTEEEWYFFSFRDRKYATGSRTNRATRTGYWKATGKDRAVHEAAPAPTPTRATAVGMRKTLVFYLGRAPNGRKTGWVMHEFRLHSPTSQPKEDWVLCRVFNKTKASSETDHGDGGGGGGNDDFAAGALSLTALLGSSPDPTVVDKFVDHRQTAAAAAAVMGGGAASASGSSSGGAALMNLQAMLQYGFMQDYFPGVHVHGGVYDDDDDAMAEMELGLGRHVGLEEHGMGEIVEIMGMEITEPRGSGSCYYDADGLYF